MTPVVLADGAWFDVDVATLIDDAVRSGRDGQLDDVLRAEYELRPPRDGAPDREVAAWYVDALRRFSQMASA